MKTKIFFLIIPLFSFLACQNSLNNRVDELYLRCGDGTVEGKDYILVDNVENGLQLDVFHSDGNLLPVTQKGCVERPKSGEVFLANKDRRLGLWVDADTKDKISLKPIQNKILPTTCNSVIHGDGLGFSLRFTSEANDLNNRFKHAKVQILTSDKSESIHTWAPRPIMPILDYQFDHDKAIAGGEYLLLVNLTDDLTNVSSQSECVLRIDYSNLRISPADTIKNIRKYNGQEVLVVEPGYEIGFYVSEGFRDVSIEYCLKKVKLDEISSILNDDFTRCDTTQDFLNSVPDKMDEGFWFISFKGRRGKIEGSWQHAFFLVDKVCNGRFESIKVIADAGCTVIKGDVYLDISNDKESIGYDVEDHKKMDWISSIQGDLVLKIVNWNADKTRDYLSIFNNLSEIGGDFNFYSSGTVHLQGFDSLRDISGIFSLSALSSLQSIQGFHNLETVGDRMDFSGLDQLISIVGFGKLKKVYHLVMTTVPMESPHFPALQELSRLEFRNMPNLKNLLGFKNVKKTNEIHLYNLPKLKSLADLDIQDRIALFELNTLDSLESLHGYRGGEIDSLSFYELRNLKAGFDKSSGVRLTGEFRLTKSPFIYTLDEFPFAKNMKQIRVTSDNLTSLAGLNKVSSLEHLALRFGSDAKNLFNEIDLKGFSKLRSIALESEGDSRLIITGANGKLEMNEISLEGFSNIQIMSSSPLNPRKLTIDKSPLTDVNFLEDLGSIGELWFVTLPIEDFSQLATIVKIETLRLSLKPENTKINGFSKLDLKNLIILSSSSSAIEVDLSELEDYASLQESLLIGDGICLRPETLKGLSDKIESPLAIAPSSYQATSYPGIFASPSSSCTPSYFN